MNQRDLKCRDERRRQLVRDQPDGLPGLNGIDYVEVIEGTGQLQLCVHFFGDLPKKLLPANVRIECGERIRDIKVIKIEPHRSKDPEHQDCLRVTVDKPGDFSCYKLCLYELKKDGDTSDKILKYFDPRYSCATFSFKVDCPSELDCKVEDICPPPVFPEPEINYLAKDYASFRQLILDRLALIMPDWQERHVPDIGIALVEILAYTGDYLSYYQDASATEAYLDTARQRISVRRHARLVDYFMHEGCNARAWISVNVEMDILDLRIGDFYFITACEGLLDRKEKVISEESLRKLNIPPDSFDVFEPIVADKDQPIRFYEAHSIIDFYTWGDAECCLEPGSTQATLVDSWVTSPVDQDIEPPKRDKKDKKEKKGKKDKSKPAESPKRDLRHLKVNDVLILEEVIGPKTGAAADADPARKWAVRLTKVLPQEDPLTGDPIVEIEWAEEDALPFALCLSARLPADLPSDRACELIENVSVACGNVLLVDHGRTVSEDIDGVVPTLDVAGECGCEGSPIEFTEFPGEFRFSLGGVPLTYSQKFDADSAASKRLTQDPREALPAAALYEKTLNLGGKIGGTKENHDGPRPIWHPKFDLLDSDLDERAFVVEIDNDGRANVRFGDGEAGRMPDAGTAFGAKYRIGNGRTGNVGAGTIKYMVSRNLKNGSTICPRNPMPASGGIDAEPISEAKLFAPGDFRKQLERAITADDYAVISGRNPKVQRAAADLGWNGSWYEARVAVDPFGAEALTGRLSEEITEYLYRYRRIGHDLGVDQAIYVPLDIEIRICVSPHYLRGHVKAALDDVFSHRMYSKGRSGFFHPDNLTFGDGIYLSALVAAAQAVEGVVSAEVTKLQRLFESANSEIANGILPLAKNEIAQLDNDPSFPERGKLTLKMTGGR